MRLISRIYRIFWVFLFGLFLLGVQNSSAQISGYKFRKEITIQASQVQGNQTNFPVLISITDPDLAANVQNANGYDIIFASDAAGNNILDHQIESYDDSNGNLVAWVKVASLSASSNTPIYMFYDNPNVSGNPSTTGVWDSNYKMVQHLNYSLRDGTSYNNDGTNKGTNPISSGKIAGAANFNRANEEYIEVDDNNDDLGINGNITVSLWMNGNSFSNNPDLATKGNFDNAYSTGINSNNRVAFTLNRNNLLSQSTINTGTWYYLTFTRNASGSRRIYIDGSVDVSDTFTAPIEDNIFKFLYQL